MASLEEIESGGVADSDGSVNAGHSMPLYSEVEGETKRTSSKRRPCLIIAIVLILLLVGAITGLTIGIISNNSDKNASNKNTSTGSSQNGNFGGTTAKPRPIPEESEDEVPVAAPQEPGKEPQEDLAAQENQALTQDPTSATEPPVPETTTAPIPEVNPNGDRRLEFIIDYLVYKGVTSRTDLETEGTYANMAVDWIANVDELALKIPASQANKTDDAAVGPEEIFITRFVLAHIYYAMGGPKWEHQANFLSSKPSCGWMEIQAGLPVGVGCTPKDGRLRSLFLSKF